MRVLLTGATGFIGSHVARRLVHDGCQVTALVRPGADLRRLTDLVTQLRLVEGDLFMLPGLLPELADVPPDLCLHLAWYAVPGKYHHAPENLDWVAGSLALLKALDRLGCPRVLMTGTCFEYDTDAGYLSETSPIQPRHLYAAAKHALYLMAEQFQRRQGRSLAWARIFYLYGPWEDSRRLVPVVIRKLLAGEPCLLPAEVLIRDFLHVQDVADSLWAVARSELAGPVNIGSSLPVSVVDIATRIGVLMGRPDLLQPGGMPAPPGDPPFICANTSRLRSNTNWSPRLDLESGLQATIEWWRQQDRPRGT